MGGCPERDRKIEEIRKRYGADIKKFRPHISLVYPFEVKDQERLFAHIKHSIKDIKSFKIILKKLEKSKREHYLYLSPIKGKNNLLNLHKKLNSGILNKFKNKDMPKYIPHLSLSNFESKKEIDNAIKELSKEKPIYKTKISAIQLLTLNKDFSIKLIKKFRLK